MLKAGPRWPPSATAHVPAAAWSVCVYSAGPNLVPAYADLLTLSWGEGMSDMTVVVWFFFLPSQELFHVNFVAHDRAQVINRVIK